MPTLTQLSKDLEVSTSTISRVLNNDSSLSISESTRKKIINYANEIGYISKISKSKPILMLYHCNPTSSADKSDPFFSEIKEAVINICKQENITLHIYRRGEIPNTTVNINGIIAIGTYNQNEINLLKEYSNNINFINSFPDLKFYDSIVVDDDQAIEDMVDFLLERNASDICFIGGNEYAPGEKEPRLNRRMNHFEYYSTKLKLNSQILIGDYTTESGYKLATTLLPKLPDAILCASDSIALGVLKCMQDNDISVPIDIQVTGFNDDRFAAQEDIGLTTMRVHKTHMAMYAIENLLNRIKSPSTIHTRTVLPATLIERNTTNNKHRN